nr:uncharacterized protein LOC109190596 [Ipomoea batatas]
MVKQLRFCDKKVQFWVLVKGKGRKNSRKPELKPLINDADIVNLVGDVPPNKELDIFVEHLFDDQWDYDVEISRELGDDCLLYDESSENEVEVEQESENEVEEDNLIDTGTSSKQGTDMDEVIAGESDVGIEDQFEDIAVETQVPTFVLEEMELMNSQPSQVVLNQGPPMSSFISSQMPTGSSNPSVITRSGKNYVTVATLQQSKVVQRETRKKKTIEKKKQN